MAVVVVAGHEGVPALDPVRKSLAQKEIQGAVDGDRGRPAAAGPGDMLNKIISPERLAGGCQEFQHLRAHRRQLLAPFGAEPLSALHGRGMVLIVMMGHERYVTIFTPDYRGQAAGRPLAAITAHPVSAGVLAVISVVATSASSFS